MSYPIIQVENLGKKYTIRHQQQGKASYKSLREVITNNLKSVRLSPSKSINTEQEDFWALKDVFFEISQGERVGIIGRNGAGKSTLLKILSRITEPTTGRIKIKGRIASLLEVGTGFHPELTGRENIFLNGAILGMNKGEIQRKFDEIVAFAEIEKFLDTPVKRYSSGMYVRLAFAVAAHLEPEILIVDEVLAVGDAQFQKKCLGKMEDVGREGRTVLFVSHQMAVIQALCQKSILLQSGCVSLIGKTSDVIAKYMALGNHASILKRSPRENGEPTITRLEICKVECYEQSVIDLELEITTSYRKQCSVEILIFDSLGVPIGLASVGLLNPKNILEFCEGEEILHSRLILPRMAGGLYRLTAQLAIPMVTVIDTTGEGLVFELHPNPLPDYERAMEQSWGYGACEIFLEIRNRKQIGGIWQSQQNH